MKDATTKITPLANVRIAYETSQHCEEYVDLVTDGLFAYVKYSDPSTVNSAIQHLLYHTEAEDSDTASWKERKLLPAEGIKWTKLTHIPREAAVSYGLPDDYPTSVPALYISFSKKDFGFGQIYLSADGNLDNEEMSQVTVFSIIVEGLENLPTITEWTIVASKEVLSLKEVLKLLSPYPCYACNVIHNSTKQDIQLELPVAQASSIVIDVLLAQAPSLVSKLRLVLSKEMVLRGLPLVLGKDTAPGEYLKKMERETYSSLYMMLGKLHKKGINLENYIESALLVTYSLERVQDL